MTPSLRKVLSMDFQTWGPGSSTARSSTAVEARNLFERRPEPSRIIHRADGHQPRARRKRIIEALPRRLHELHAATAQVRRIVIMIRKLVFQRDDLVARLPIQTAQQQRQARRRI